MLCRFGSTFIIMQRTHKSTQHKSLQSLGQTGVWAARIVQIPEAASPLLLN